MNRSTLKKLASPKKWKKAATLLLTGRFREFAGKLTASQAAGNRAYQAWQKKHPLTDAHRIAIREKIASWKHPPKISVIVPVYNTPEKYLREAIESVQSQLYKNWELCIADDCSPKKHIREILEEFRAADQRIKVVYREKNGHISEASNSALELATGEFSAFLDHDDVLTETALFRVAEAIVAQPELDMLYSDEDKLDESGHFVEPFFKPDWSPEFLTSCMYTCHLGTYRTSLLRELGGLRSEFNGSQDYDLVLRLTEKTQRIHHIREVLYHWREIPGSTASGHSEKPYAHLAGKRALESRFPGCEVEEREWPGTYRVQFPIVRKPLVSILLFEDGVALKSLANSIEGIRRTSYPNAELIVCDIKRPAERHHSKRNQTLTEFVGNFPPGFIELDHDRWYRHGESWAESMNHAAGRAAGEFLVFLSGAVSPCSAEWLEALLFCAQQDGVGAVGGKLVSKNRILDVGVNVDNGQMQIPFRGEYANHPGYFLGNHLTRNCAAIGGECIMTPVEVFRQLKGLDKEYHSNIAAVDFCVRATKAGKRIVYEPAAEFEVQEAAVELHAKDLEKFRTAHAGFINPYPYGTVAELLERYPENLV